MLWEGDCACGGRAISNGMEKMTRSLWRLDIVQRRTPFVVSDRCTIPDMNLHCGATRLLRRERCVQRSLPCVDSSGKGAPTPSKNEGKRASGNTVCKRGLEPEESCCGNHLGCRKGFYGIAVRTKWQSGPMAGNTMAQRLTGNRLTGDGRRAAGKSNPYLSRKINLRRCPVQCTITTKRGIYS